MQGDSERKNAAIDRLLERDNPFSVSAQQLREKAEELKEKVFKGLASTEIGIADDWQEQLDRRFFRPKKEAVSVNISIKNNQGDVVSRILTTTEADLTEKAFEAGILESISKLIKAEQ